MKTTSTRLLATAGAVLILTPLMVVGSPAQEAQAAISTFIQRSGDVLFDDLDGDEARAPNEPEFRFIGSNMLGAVISSDNHQFDLTDDERWRFTDEFEKRDLVETAVQAGQRVVRTWALRVTNNLGFFNNGTYTAYVGANPVLLKEDALRSLDKFLQICNEKGIRAIIPFIDGPGHYGGIGEYGSVPSFFTVGSSTNLKFKNVVSQLLNRTNFYTGVKYKDDKAILAWETGNELSADGQYLTLDNWVADLAAFIKGTGSYSTAIDDNHLIMDGRNDPAGFYNRYTILTNPDVDIVSAHTYFNLPGMSATQSIQALRSYTAGHKPLNIGEVSPETSSSELNGILGGVVAGGTNSAMWWAFRGHNRDGGFYHHFNFSDLHWPGFPGAVGLHSDIQKEIDLINVLASRSYEIQGLTRPALPIPASPTLLPISDIGHISWQGSTGAQSYQIQRAPTSTGPWTTIASDFSDNTIAVRPLFSDETAVINEAYYYRVQAKNTSGGSPQSNVVGPVTVESNWLVDEMFDDTKMFSRSAGTTILRTYSEVDGNQDDLARLARTTATQQHVIYRVDGDIDALKMLSYGNKADYTFSTSADGATYTPTAATVSTYSSARKKYELNSFPTGSRYIKIQFEDTTTSTLPAIGRVEIQFGATSNAEIVDNNDASVAYSGSWIHASDPIYYNATKSVSNTSGSSATFTFVGTKIDVITRTTPSSGRYDVYIDGVFDATVDAFSSTDQAQVVTYSKSGLSPAPHTIEIRLNGQKHASSGGYYVGFDAFAYEPSGVTVDDGSPSITYSGSWSHAADANYFSGTKSVSSSSGSRAELSFTGTEIRVYTKTSPSNGKYDVYIDNVFDATVDAYSPADAFKVNTYSKTGLTSGTHTVSLRLNGQKNPSSTGYFIGFDQMEYR